MHPDITGTFFYIIKLKNLKYHKDVFNSSSFPDSLFLLVGGTGEKSAGHHGDEDSSSECSVYFLT